MCIHVYTDASAQAHTHFDYIYENTGFIIIKYHFSRKLLIWLKFKNHQDKLNTSWQKSEMFFILQWCSKFNLSSKAMSVASQHSHQIKIDRWIEPDFGTLISIDFTLADYFLPSALLRIFLSESDLKHTDLISEETERDWCFRIFSLFFVS